MQSILVNPDSIRPEHLDRAVSALRAGELVVFPTETVYGLTADPDRADALEALFRRKGRPPSRRLPLVAADLAQAESLVSFEPPLARILAERFWPGPLTLVLPYRPRRPLAEWDWGSTLAIRVPALELARRLARDMGRPLPATSANRSGEPASGDPAVVRRSLGKGPGLFLDAGVLPPQLPSTILDLTAGPPRILRPGAVPVADLAPYLDPTAIGNPGRTA